MLEFGTIHIVKPPPVGIKPEFAFGNISVTFQSPVISNDSKAGTRIDSDSVTSLGVPNYNLKPQFEGVRLSKDGIFDSIFDAIIEAAAFNRTQPFKDRVTVEGHAGGVVLTFRPWKVPPAPPYLEYCAMIYMFCSIPKYMYRVNKFQAGSFVIEVDGQPHGYGEIIRQAPTAIS